MAQRPSMRWFSFDLQLQLKVAAATGFFLYSLQHLMGELNSFKMWFKLKLGLAEDRKLAHNLGRTGDGGSQERCFLQTYRCANLTLNGAQPRQSIPRQGRQ